MTAPHPNSRVEWCGEDHPHNAHLWAQDNRVEVPDFGEVEIRKVPGAQPAYLLADCPGSTGAALTILDVREGDTVICRIAHAALATVEAARERLKDKLPDGVRLLVVDDRVSFDVIRKEAS